MHEYFKGTLPPSEDANAKDEGRLLSGFVSTQSSSCEMRGFDEDQYGTLGLRALEHSHDLPNPDAKFGTDFLMMW
uniref:Uncharacterized protein n=1 Tax=Panagrellus redivivus TaxID=6233 RepID=A0A7E4W8F8_PANRE